jgi:hypothetical protein
LATKRKTKSVAAPAGELREERSARRLRAQVEAHGLRELLKAYKEPGRPRATYRGAAQTRLDTPWSATTIRNARNRERALRQDFRQLRGRARDLERENVLAGAVLDRAVENVIGPSMSF